MEGEIGLEVRVQWRMRRELEVHDIEVEMYSRQQDALLTRIFFVKGDRYQSSQL